MKNLLMVIMVVCLMFAVIGCSSVSSMLQDVGIKISPKFEDLADMALAYNAALELGYQYPDKIDEGIKHCDALLSSSGEFNYLYNIGISALKQMVGDDPIKSGNLELFLSAVEIEGSINIKNAKVIVLQFKRGLEDRKKMTKSKPDTATLEWDGYQYSIEQNENFYLYEYDSDVTLLIE